MSNRTSRLEFLLSLVDRVSSPLARITQRFESLQQHAMGGITKIGAGLAGLAGTGAAVANGIQPARDVAASLGEVQSLGVASDELKKLENQALLSSAKYGTAAAEFIGASYDIQSAISGLKPGQLGVVTASMDALAIATKADVADMTSLMGGMYGIFQNSADKMGVGKFSQQVAAFTAKSVQMFKTTGKGMEDAFRSVGSLAQANGIAMANQFAVMGTLQATMPGAEAGTKYKAFLAGVLNAQDKLKMKFTDTKGAMLPMVDILEKIKAKYGDLDATDISKLSKGFGSQEAVMVITGLIDKTDQLRKSIASVSSADFGLVEKMALSIADPFAKAETGIESVTAKLGLLFLPQINGVMDNIATLTQRMMSWIDINPELSKTLTKVGFGMLAVIASIATLALIAGVAQLAMAGVGLAFSALLAPAAFLVAGVATLAFMWGELSKRSSSADGLIAGVKYLAGVAWKQMAAFLETIGDGFRSVLTPLLDLIPASNNLLRSLFSLGNALDGPTSNARFYGKIFGKVLAYLAIGVIALKVVTISAMLASKAWAVSLYALAIAKRVVAFAGIAWNAVMGISRALLLATLIQVRLLRISTLALATAQKAAAFSSFLLNSALAAGRLLQVIANTIRLTAVTWGLIAAQKATALSSLLFNKSMAAARLAMLGLAAGAGILKAGLLLALSPVGLLVGAVIGLVAAGVWLYKNWESVKATFSDMSWSEILNKALSFIVTPIGKFNGLLKLLQSIWGSVTEGLSNTSWGKPILEVIDKISGAIRKALGPLKELKSFANDKIEGAVNGVSNFASSVTTEVTGFFGWSDDSPKLGSPRARGGDVRSGYMHRVNEHMPELLSISGQTFLMMGDYDGKVQPLHEKSSGNLLSVARKESHLRESMMMQKQQSKAPSTRPARSLSVTELHVHTQAQDIDPQTLLAAMNQAF